MEGAGGGCKTIGATNMGISCNMHERARGREEQEAAGLRRRRVKCGTISVGATGPDSSQTQHQEAAEKVTGNSLTHTHT